MIGYPAILATLQSAAGQRPELSAALRLHCDLIGMLAEATPLPCTPPVEPDEATWRLSEGRPLLAGNAVRLDATLVRTLCRQVASIGARHRTDLSKALECVATWIDTEDCVDLAQPESLTTAIDRGTAQVGVDPELLAFVLNNALHPILRVYAESLAPYLADGDWRLGYCPACGGAPDFAALEKDSGERRLLCSVCDTEWHFPRVGCPFCGDERPNSYFPAVEGAYRLYVCDACRCYLKTIDLRETIAERPLAAERILTVEMDLAARMAGYRPALFLNRPTTAP